MLIDLQKILNYLNWQFKVLATVINRPKYRKNQKSFFRDNLERKVQRSRVFSILDVFQEFPSNFRKPYKFTILKDSTFNWFIKIQFQTNNFHLVNIIIDRSKTIISEFSREHTSRVKKLKIKILSKFMTQVSLREKF